MDRLFASVRQRSRLGRRLAVGTRVVALALTTLLLSASLTLAITWGPIRALGNQQRNHSDPAVVGTGATSAVAAYVSAPASDQDLSPTDGIWVRRTTDSGISWSAPRQVATGLVWGPRLAAARAAVDLVWIDRETSRVMYRRSPDRGTTWEAGRWISPPGVDAAFPDVARGPSGQVTIIWSADGGELRVKSSLDGGDTFLPSRRLRSTDPENFSEGRIKAAGGVTYVAFYSDPSTIRLRRSLDGGISWGPAVPIARDATQYRDFDLAAASKVVAVAYVRTERGLTRAVYRRSVDLGLGWSAPGRLSPLADVVTRPTIDARAGIWIATWSQLEDTGDSSVRRSVFHRSSTSAARSWSSVAKVGMPFASDWEFAFTGESTTAGRQIIVFSGQRGLNVTTSNAFARSGE